MNTLQPISSAGWCTNHRTSVPHATCGSFYQLDQAQLSSWTLCRQPAACSISGNCLSDNLHSALEERFLQSCPFLVTLPVFSCNPSGGLWSSAVHVTWEDNMMLPFYSCLKLCNRFQRNTEIIAVRFEELCSLLPTLIQLMEHVVVLLRPAVQGLGWVVGTCIKAEKRGGGNCQCVRSVSTWDGNEFWEISSLKIGRACGSHLLGNSSLCYETIMCYDYISDKGYQWCCQIVSAEVFQHRRSSLCSSWLWLVFVSWLGHWDDSSCAVAHRRMWGEDSGTSSPALACVCTVCWSCGQLESITVLVSQVKFSSSSFPTQIWRSSVFISLPAGLVNRLVIVFYED